jgi:hypothetical protein
MYNHIARATARLFTTSQSRFATVYTIKGSPEQVEDKNVRLRGIHIKSDLRDAPNMIFFPEVFDKVENWIPFFTNPLHRVNTIVIAAKSTTKHLCVVSSKSRDIR